MRRDLVSITDDVFDLKSAEAMTAHRSAGLRHGVVDIRMNLGDATP